MMIAALIFISAVLALNMGASGIVPSFCTSYGAKFLTKNRIMLMFGIFVTVGALLLGSKVVKTLSGGIVPAEYLNTNVVLIILTAGTISLFIANFLKIPQSTSWITVFSLTAVGLYSGALNVSKFYILVPTWIILPTVSYLSSLMFYKFIYPPGKRNFVLYEKLLVNESKLRVIAIIANCYVAFAIGANNVANVVGPLKAAHLFGSTSTGLLAVAPLFGIGAMLFGEGNLSSFGKGIAPLGLVTSTYVSLTTASLLLIASMMGIPQSLVQLNAASIFAVSHVKDGFFATTSNKTTKKTFYVWMVTPVLSFTITYLILVIAGRR